MNKLPCAIFMAVKLRISEPYNTNIKKPKYRLINNIGNCFAIFRDALKMLIICVAPVSSFVMKYEKNLNV